MTLNSWKEIANYIGRGVRTVQRWELFFGLPVHRPAGRNRSAVYALRSEVDDWLQTRPVRDGIPTFDGDGITVINGDGSANGSSDPVLIRKRITELEAELQYLRKQLAQSRRAPLAVARIPLSTTKSA